MSAPMIVGGTRVRLEPWGPDDGPLLARLVGDPAMMEHLGGPEPPEKIADRQRRYGESGSDQYRIVAGDDSGGIGWVGFWEREGMDGWEVGWAVVPSWQGRGVARRATGLLLEIMRSRPEHRWVHAFPSVDNVPSNRVCERLGFELLGALAFEYPPGHWMKCNDWRYDLRGVES